MLGTFPSAFFSHWQLPIFQSYRRISQAATFQVYTSCNPRPLACSSCSAWAPNQSQPGAVSTWEIVIWEDALGKCLTPKKYILCHQQFIKNNIFILFLLGHIVLNIIFPVSVQTPALSLYLHQSIQINTRSVMDSILSLSAVLRQEACFYIHIFIYRVFHIIGIIRCFIIHIIINRVVF